MAFPLNRRQLLGAGLAAAIPSAHAFIPVKVPQKWDDTVDVLCVGTGFSGLAAAIEAHNAGASVLVIDKILKTVESTLSQIRRRRARGTSGLWPSSP